MTPNIRPKATPHSECWRQDWLARLSQVGDVRWCPHRKVQILTEVNPNARMAGPGTNWWRTLHPILTPILHRRARAALMAGDD